MEPGDHIRRCKGGQAVGEGVDDDIMCFSILFHVSFACLFIQSSLFDLFLPSLTSPIYIITRMAKQLQKKGRDQVSPALRHNRGREEESDSDEEFRPNDRMPAKV